MDNNNDKILADQTVGKEYQIPELVDLNGVGEASGFGCADGSSGSPCGTGGLF